MNQVASKSSTMLAGHNGNRTSRNTPNIAVLHACRRNLRMFAVLSLSGDQNNSLEGIEARGVVAQHPEDTFGRMVDPERIEANAKIFVQGEDRLAVFDTLLCRFCCDMVAAAILWGTMTRDGKGYFGEWSGRDVSEIMPKRCGTNVGSSSRQKPEGDTPRRLQPLPAHGNSGDSRGSGCPRAKNRRIQ